MPHTPQDRVGPPGFCDPFSFQYGMGWVACKLQVNIVQQKNVGRFIFHVSSISEDKIQPVGISCDLHSSVLSGFWKSTAREISQSASLPGFQA